MTRDDAAAWCLAAGEWWGEKEAIEDSKVVAAMLLGVDDAGPSLSVEAPGGFQKWRKKPVVVEAWQFDGRLETILAMSAAGLEGIGAACREDGTFTGEMVVRTLEGRMTAREGDYIIRGVAGELYPCKAEIFAATYEPAGEGETDGESREG